MRPIRRWSSHFADSRENSELYLKANQYLFSPDFKAFVKGLLRAGSDESAAREA